MQVPRPEATPARNPTRAANAEAFVQAGADMLALGNNLSYDPAIAEHTIGILLQAVATGAISEQRIDESVARIMALKARWGG